MNTPLPTITDPRKISQGGLLTFFDLPKKGTNGRWTPSKKAIIAEAIRKNLMSAEEACDRYYMTVADLRRWIDLLSKQGIRGLAVNNFQADYVPEKLDDVASIEDGTLSIDFNLKIVKLDDRMVHITANQLRLLSILIRRAPASLSREDAYALLYGGRTHLPQSKILDVMICKLRHRLGADAIETVWGRGWRWNGAASRNAA